MLAILLMQQNKADCLASSQSIQAKQNKNNILLKISRRI